MNENTAMPFDADAFMGSTIDAPLETEYKVCPEGKAYRAVIGDFTSDAFKVFEFDYSKGPRAGERGSMLKFSCPFIIQDDKARAAMNKADDQPLIVYKEMIIDRDDSGRIETGTNKNVDLGMVRQAVGQNTTSAWGPAQLRNCGPVIVEVRHETFKRADGTPGKKAVVGRVAMLK
jgi:hypothetical protein